MRIAKRDRIGGFCRTSTVWAMILIGLVVPCANTYAKAALDQASSKPNIVFILADDLGWGDVGCYGQTKIQTPNIDALASEGLKFSQAYAGCPVCAPSMLAAHRIAHRAHAYSRQ